MIINLQIHKSICIYSFFITNLRRFLHLNKVGTTTYLGPKTKNIEYILYPLTTSAAII